MPQAGVDGAHCEQGQSGQVSLHMTPFHGLRPTITLSHPCLPPQHPTRWSLAFPSPGTAVPVPAVHSYSRPSHAPPSLTHVQNRHCLALLLTVTILGWPRHSCLPHLAPPCQHPKSPPLCPSPVSAVAVLAPFPLTSPLPSSLPRPSLPCQHPRSPLPSRSPGSAVAVLAQFPLTSPLLHSRHAPASPAYKIAATSPLSCQLQSCGGPATPAHPT